MPNFKLGSWIQTGGKPRSRDELSLRLLPNRHRVSRICPSANSDGGTQLSTNCECVRVLVRQITLGRSWK